MSPSLRRLGAHPRERGQALVEFALVSILLALLLGGVVEFGLLFAHKVELANAARSGARWAATHSTGWDPGAAPASNSIEGQVLGAGGTSQLANDDSHLAIEYFTVSGSTRTPCGSYSVAASAFVAAGGFTQATCVVPGSLVRVTVTNTFSPVTSLLAWTRATLRGVATTLISA